MIRQLSMDIQVSCLIMYYWSGPDVVHVNSFNNCVHDMHRLSPRVCPSDTRTSLGNGRSDARYRPDDGQMLNDTVDDE